MSRYSGQARGGGSGAVWTGWVSETSLACKVGSGGTGSVGMAATVGEIVASMSGGLSYETGTMSGGPSRNVGVAGGDVVSLSGRGFGTSRYVLVSAYLVVAEAMRGLSLRSELFFR